MKVVLLFLLVFSNVALVGQKNDELSMEMYQKVRSDFKDISELKLSSVQGLVDKKNIVFVDVRTKQERDVSTIPGAISAKEFESKIKQHQKKIVAVYCTIGYRSAKYIRKLKKRNISAYNLEGSLLGWLHNGRLVTNPRGRTVKTVHVYGSSWNLLPKGYKGVW